MTTYTQHVRTAFSFIAIATACFLLTASFAFAASDTASSNVSFTQGTQKNGGLVDVSRSNPAEALGAPDGSYVTLGYGGELIVGFSQSMSGNLQLAVHEVTGGSYPLETADVYVSTNPAGPWTNVGEASNEEGEEDGISEFPVSACYQYVRVVDTTDDSLHDDSSDGFDVDAFSANYDETCPQGEEPKMHPHTGARISLHSGAMVINETETIANTGGNLADGSYAGAGGDGGSIENTDGEQDVEGAATGNGGVGGDGGLGGAVQTGDAVATASITNTVNRNIVRIDGCECDNTYDRVRVRTHDFAFLANRTGTGANTGDNDALGSYGNDGGDGGDIENGDRRGEDDDDNQEIDDVTTGTGGNGGTGNTGGSVLTGQATARAEVVNLVNSNRIRVR